MTGDIFIYGVIGTLPGEISFDNVKKQLEANKEAKELTLHVISPGGDVFEGYSIYNALKNTGKNITGQIEGTCASIATLVVAAANKVVMNKTAQFMIHNPKVSGFNRDADSKELRNVAQQLDQIKTLLIDVYEPKTGLSKEKLWELYDNETWLTAAEAAQMGFVDEAVDAIKAVAKINLPKIKDEMEKDTSALKNLMTKVYNLLKFKNEARETLEDGTVILVMTDDGDYTGKQVSYEDGSPVPPGDYKLAAGRMIVVGEGSVITEVKDAAPADNANNEEDEMKKDEEIANLKAQLAEAQSALQSATAQATTAKADKVKFENRLKTVESDFLKLKEEVTKTFGEEPDEKKGPVFKNSAQDANEDPMGDEILTFYRNRNFIKK